MIVKGNVRTSEGPVPVENLKEGDLIIDRSHRARKLLGIETAEVSETLSFKKNTDVVLSADTTAWTATGKKTLSDGNKVTFMLPNGIMMYDTAVVNEETVVGYNLTIEDGTDVYVDGYNVGV